MGLSDPVAVYNAATNFEAHVLCNILVDAGIEAYVTEDLSQVGVWLGGLVPELHKPQVWANRTDVERIKPILDDYEKRRRELRAEAAGREKSTADVGAVCEECGATANFPAALAGTVQTCSQCGAYLDVDEVATGEPPDGEAAEGTEEGE